MKNITLLILGFILISMIATESMLRTDDYDTLRYESDSEEVKTTADPRGPVPTANECGPSIADVGTDGTKCYADTVTSTERCCQASYVSGKDVAPVLRCLKGIKDDFISEAADLKATVKALYTLAENQTLDVTCPPKKEIPAVTPGKCLKGDKNTGLTEVDCLAASTVETKCCLVTPRFPADAATLCVAGTASRSASKTANDEVKYPFTVKSAVCGSDATVATASDCFTDATEDQKKALTDKLCAHDLKSRCCLVKGSDDKSFCIKADPLKRNDASALAKSTLQVKYGESAKEVSCLEFPTATLPDDNQCGIDSKTKKVYDKGYTPALNETLCNTDKEKYCCAGYSLDKTKIKCLSNGKIKDANVNTTAVATFSETYADLSDVKCSSGFISASIVAVLAVAMALF